MITVINTDTPTDQQTQADPNPVSVLMTVDLLISIRERITNQIPGFWHQVSIVNDIDAMLSQIPAGTRRDIDGLLGRWTIEILPDQTDLLEQWHERM